jgi:hypothetical protein
VVTDARIAAWHVPCSGLVPRSLPTSSPGLVERPRGPAGATASAEETDMDNARESRCAHRNRSHGKSPHLAGATMPDKVVRAVTGGKCRRRCAVVP